VNPRADFQNQTGLKRILVRGILISMQDMKMLFSARSRAQIERARAKLLAAGVRCEIRDFPVDEDEAGTASYPELWVESNSDYHTASILYASPLQVLQQQTSGKW
jgi:hypothetical protein